MRRPEVSDDEILSAGRKLCTEGKEVTGWSLRVAVGDRGKPARLYEVWKATEEVAAHAVPDARAVQLPPRLDEHRVAMQQRSAADLDGLVLATWRAAEEIAESRTREERDLARATIERSEQELADAAASVEATEARENVLLDQADLRAAELATARADIVRLTERIAGAERDVQAAAVRIADLDGRLETADTATDIARREAAASNATAEAALADAGRLRAELETTKTETVDLRRNLDAARESLSARTTEATTATERAERLQADLDGERRIRATLDERLALTVERALVAEARVAVGVEAAQAAEARMLEAVSRAVAAEQRLADLEAAIPRPLADSSTAAHA